MVRSAHSEKLSIAVAALLADGPQNMRAAMHEIADAQGVKL